MNGFLALVASALAFSSAAVAQIAPGSNVHVELASNTNICLSAPAAQAGAPIVSEQCGTDRTTFLLTGGSGTDRQLVLENTTLCISARHTSAAGNVLELQFCEDDALQRWTIPASSGEIVSQADSTKCLTISSAGTGITASYDACSGAVGQVWNPVVV